jgi:hypothetical protein
MLKKKLIKNYFTTIVEIIEDKPDFIISRKIYGLLITVSIF